MPRPMFDAEFIHGIHEPGGEGHMLDQGKPGWILFTEGLGADPNNHGGRDYRQYADRGIGVMARLNHGYGHEGTIPDSGRYEAFAQRCANFVRASAGCKIWLIGNEMNFSVERPHIPGRGLPEGGRELPPADDPLFHGHPNRFSALRRGDSTESGGTRSAETGSRGVDTPGFETITPKLYARCYRLCRDAIHAVPGHADDQVLIGSVAPWNDQTSYPGNESGDWVEYFRDILLLLGPDGCDGITIHTYTDGEDPALIESDHFMGHAFSHLHYHFRTYRDFMDAVPPNMRHLPMYITETDQNIPWVDRNSGWVQRAYAEIDAWNNVPGNQQIRALILYRWPNIDRWVIEGRGAVIEDFRQAIARGYRWRDEPPIPLEENWAEGDQVAPTGNVNMRRTPGYRGKPADDVLQLVAEGTPLTVRAGGFENADGLVWWPLRLETDEGGPVDGWMAQFAPSGRALLEG